MQTTDKSAIGSTDKSTAFDKKQDAHAEGTVTQDTRGQPSNIALSAQASYDVPAVKIGNQVNDGDEFILLTRTNQGEGFRIWSSASQTETSQLFEQASRQLQTMPQYA